MATLQKALEQMAEIAEVYGETHKEAAYKKAARIVGEHTAPDGKTDVGAVLIRVGASVRRLITEFVQTGRIDEAESELVSEEYKTMKSFTRITGVGPKTAAAWYDLGFTSIPELTEAARAGAVCLTEMQKYGLIYYNDLQLRIPRDEVTCIGHVIKEVLTAGNPKVIFSIAGSYRRELATSGDVDVIITSKKYDDELLENSMAILRSREEFVGALAEGRERSSLLFRSATSGRVRQVDLLNVRHETYHAALLYFTGDFSFNERMRGWAKVHGYRLNQRGLFKDGQLVPTSSEADIFRALGLQYVDPPARTAANVAPA